MISRNIILWLTALLAMLLGVWLCRGSLTPKLPHAKQLMSPKDAASRAPAIVIPPAPFTNRLTLAWNRGDSLTNIYGYVVEYRTNLSSCWVEVGRYTNTAGEWFLFSSIPV